MQSLLWRDSRMSGIGDNACQWNDRRISVQGPRHEWHGEWNDTVAPPMTDGSDPCATKPNGGGFEPSIRGPQLRAIRQGGGGEELGVDVTNAVQLVVLHKDEDLLR